MCRNIYCTAIYFSFAPDSDIIIDFGSVLSAKSVLVVVDGISLFFYYTARNLFVFFYLYSIKIAA